MASAKNEVIGRRPIQYFLNAFMSLCPIVKEMVANRAHILVTRLILLVLPLRGETLMGDKRQENFRTEYRGRTATTPGYSAFAAAACGVRLRAAAFDIHL
jgi:hypothetical protein